MRVEFKTVKNYDEEHAVINAVTITDDLQSAIDILSHNQLVLPVTDGEETLMCRFDQIYYIESIDKRTYIYTKDNCYETKYRLYELDEKLSNNFLRCAKAMIINIRKIKSVKSEINGRMTATLLNGEQVIIARSYVKNLKERIGI